MRRNGRGKCTDEASGSKTHVGLMRSALINVLADLGSIEVKKEDHKRYLGV